MSNPLRRNAGAAENGPGGAALRAETAMSTANWTTLVRARPTTVAVVNGFVADISWRELWAIGCGRRTGDALGDATMFPGAPEMTEPPVFTG